jgi:CBS domain-containing protein
MAAQTIRSIMTTNLVALDSARPASDAAREMRDQAIGDVLVTEGDGLFGIVTDRDIIVRCVADGKNPTQTSLRDVCSRDVRTLKPGDDVSAAVQLAKSAAVRRIPVVDDHGQLLGIVSLGDLAQELDSRSALARISAAPPSD